MSYCETISRDHNGKTQEVILTETHEVQAESLPLTIPAPLEIFGVMDNLLRRVVSHNIVTPTPPIVLTHFPQLMKVGKPGNERALSLQYCVEAVQGQYNMGADSIGAWACHSPNSFDWKLFTLWIILLPQNFEIRKLGLVEALARQIQKQECREGWGWCWLAKNERHLGGIVLDLWRVPLPQDPAKVEKLQRHNEGVEKFFERATRTANLEDLTRASGAFEIPLDIHPAKLILGR